MGGSKRSSATASAARDIRLTVGPRRGWQEQFRAIGLENVRAEPVEMPYWEPRGASLSVTDSTGATHDIACFPVPLAAPTQGIEAEVVSFERETSERVAGAISLYDNPLLRVPSAYYRDHLATWSFDPEKTFDGGVHVLPFARGMQGAMEPSMEAGALALVGVLSGYPGDSREYYVPYDAKHRPIPGVWISGSDGARIAAMLERGPVRARLTVDAETSGTTAPLWRIVNTGP